MKKAFLILSFALPLYATAQVQDDLDGKFLIAETKQVGQFFRRFNSEEGFKGKRFSKRDTLYHSKTLRQFYISNAFDKFNHGISEELKASFIDQVVNRNPQYLDFHGGDWFAQVDAMFKYNGKLEHGILFLSLEKENKGYKWVLSNIYFYPFVEMFNTVTDGWNDKNYGKPKMKKYIHPKSHELHFINLKSALNDTDVLEDYIKNDHQPDFLTLFIFEMKRKKLALQSINKVKFHFFQINNWYFELAKMRRDSKNSGWLISDIAYVSEKDKNLLKQYVFMRKNVVNP